MWKWCIALTLLALAGGLMGQNLHAVYAQDTQEVQAAPALSQPVMKTERFMKKFADPLADTLHEMLANDPGSPREWRKVEDEASSGAEIANLIAIRNDEDAQNPEWQELTKGMFDASIALAEAAKTRDFAATKMKYEALVASCNACHTKIDPETLPVIEP